MNKISNPLTIIGVFSGIAEVAGTVVLPLVSQDLQKIFIWYVMVFPIILVVLFFITLIIKPQVLYAPSDYSDEKNFVNLISKKLEQAKVNDPAIADALTEVQMSLVNDLPEPQQGVLEALHLFKDGVTIAELSKRVGVSKAYTYRLLRELVKSGYVKYVSSGEESRYSVMHKGD